VVAHSEFAPQLSPPPAVALQRYATDAPEWRDPLQRSAFRQGGGSPACATGAYFVGVVRAHGADPALQARYQSLQRGREQTSIRRAEYPRWAFPEGLVEHDESWYPDAAVPISMDDFRSSYQGQIDRASYFETEVLSRPSRPRESSQSVKARALTALNEVVDLCRAHARSCGQTVPSELSNVSCTTYNLGETLGNKAAVFCIAHGYSNDARLGVLQGDDAVATTEAGEMTAVLFRATDLGA
jgi:hypothetical protein